MTPYPELQQIIREETDNGRGIVQFLFKAMWGEFAKFTPQHQLMAGRALAIIGVEQGIQFVEANRPPSLPTVQVLNGHPDRCSCRTCERSAMDRFRQTHCQEGEEIHQYIVRRALTSTSDDSQLVSEATLIWNEYMSYIRNLCPESRIAPIPGWFSRLLERDEHYPDGYNPKLVDKTYDFWMGGGLDDDDEYLMDEDCDCEDCEDHERDDYGNCLCPICFESEDDP